MNPAIRNSFALAVLAAGVIALSPGPANRTAPGAPALQDVVPSAAGTLVVDLVDGASLSDLQTVEGLIGADLDWTHPLSVDEALAEGQVSDLQAAMRALSGHPLVEVVEPSMMMHHTGDASYSAPNDPMYERQWNLKAMGAPTGWSVGAMGSGVIVAVIDTGVSKVEDLQGTTMLAGASFVPKTKTAADDQGHGTHVAGTIAQTTNNGVGVAGVAPKATILPVKVLSRFGSGQSSWIASGIDYAVDEGAQVINLSLGGGYSAVIHNAIKKAQKKGVIVVAAAGNSSRRGVGYPGALKETIGVSATGPDGKLAPYSSYGKGVDIAAPGGDKRKRHGGILQDTVDTRGGHHYVEYQGTSMATPHVAGAAAVLLSRGMPSAKVVDTLLTSAKGDGEWNEKYGHGQLDLSAALGQAPTGTTGGGILFFLGGLFAFLLAQMTRTSSEFRMKSTVAGSVAAGGLFFLAPLLPDFLLTRLVTTGLVVWPDVLLGAGWSHFPLWASAALPFGLAFSLGAYHKTRPFALGVCAAFGASLLVGAVTGSIAPWGMPSIIATAWLGANALASIVLGMGMAGTEVLEQMERKR